MQRLALVLSFSVGLLSLSQEIAWVRLVSFVLGGRPHAFSAVLTAFLIGIAIGAIAGRWLCARSSHLVRDAGWVLLTAAGADICALYSASALLDRMPSNRALLLLVPAITVTAALKGVLFPIVHHLGSNQSAGRIGRSVSRVYIGNVLGSTFGPIITGFVLLDAVSVESVFALIAVSTVFLGALTLVSSSSHWSIASSAVVVALALVCAYGVVRPPDVVTAVAKGSRRDADVRHVIQNRHGIIHVLAEENAHKGDITWGGNVYDGRISVDMSINSNGLDRAYLVATMHPKPRRTLVIGMSTGAWTRVVSGFPDTESVDVVEINPGYLQLIGMYPAVSSLLTDPRVKIHVDDGRRWLRAHPQERYDVILQNTTFHWRAYTTLLLSKEYFQELRGHLNEGGIVAFNTTGSMDAYRTALETFPYVVWYANFAYMSDRPLKKRSDAEQVLRSCLHGTDPAFPPELFVDGAIGQRLADEKLQSARDLIAAASLAEPARVITDLNLVPEFRHGRPPFRALRPLLPPTPDLD